MRGFTHATDPLTNRAVATGSLKCRPWWRIPLPKCDDGPSGLAFDSGLLIAACSSVAKIIRASDGSQLAVR